MTPTRMLRRGWLSPGPLTDETTPSPSLAHRSPFFEGSWSALSSTWKHVHSEDQKHMSPDAHTPSTPRSPFKRFNLRRRATSTVKQPSTAPSNLTSGETKTLQGTLAPGESAMRLGTLPSTFGLNMDGDIALRRRRTRTPDAVPSNDPRS